MHRIRIESTALTSIGYDAASQSLEVEFKDGRIYEYQEVPAVVYAALLASPSKGGYLNRAIRGRYLTCRLEMSGS
jgi:hypothetical protein